MAVILFLAVYITALSQGPVRLHRVGPPIMSLSYIPPQDSFYDYLTKQLSSAYNFYLLFKTLYLRTIQHHLVSFWTLNTFRSVMTIAPGSS